MTRSWIVLLLVGAAACAPAGARPIEPRVGDDTCAQCRMTLLSIATAGQIAAPGLEPMVFDDLGCLREYLRAHPWPADALVFVADHRTGMWLEARHALLTRAAVRTPMDSRVIAHADRESQEADPDALHGEPLAVEWLLPPEKKGDTP